MAIDFKNLLKKGFGEALEIVAAVLGGAFSHWFITEMRGGKRVFTGLDKDKIRTDAPHFAKTKMDEAEFITVKNGLNPALIKSLEGWMSSLGNNQRDNVILVLAETTARLDLDTEPIINRAKAREAALKALEQLAEAPDVIVVGYARNPWQNKDNHAVAFGYMKRNESDYLGARITAQAADILQALLADLTELRDWMDASALQHQLEADRIYATTRARNQKNFFSKALRGFGDAFNFRF